MYPASNNLNQSKLIRLPQANHPQMTHSPLPVGIQLRRGRQALSLVNNRTDMDVLNPAPIALKTLSAAPKIPFRLMIRETSLHGSAAAFELNRRAVLPSRSSRRKWLPERFPAAALHPTENRQTRNFLPSGRSNHAKTSWRFHFAFYCCWF